MGRIFDALQRSKAENPVTPHVTRNLAATADATPNGASGATGLDDAPLLNPQVKPEQRLVTLNGQASLGAEKIRILAAKLRQLQDQQNIRKVLVTSTVKNEGKTVLSTNLCISLARMRQRVLLIDGDCHQANAVFLLGATGLPGLMDWWHSEAPINEYLTRYKNLPLWFLPAGRMVEQPLEILQSARVSELVAMIAGWFDWVVIDSPPSAPLADASVWAKMVDGILLVTRDGKTPKRLLRKVLDSFAGHRLLGIVLNDCSDPDQQYYNQYYNLHKPS